MNISVRDFNGVTKLQLCLALPCEMTELNAKLRSSFVLHIDPALSSRIPQMLKYTRYRRQRIKEVDWYVMKCI